MTTLDLWEFYSTLNGDTNALRMLSDIMDSSKIDERIDKDILAMEILAECGDLEPMYNTTSAYKMFAQHFFNFHYNEFKRLMDIELSNYDPLTDYDITKHYTTQKSGTDEYEHDNTTSHTGTDSETTVHQVSADNESDFQNREKDVENTDYGNSKQDKGSNSVTFGNLLTHDYKESGRKLPAQDLILKELEVLGKVSVYKVIAVQFGHEMCITVS